MQSMPKTRFALAVFDGLIAETGGSATTEVYLEIVGGVEVMRIDNLMAKELRKGGRYQRLSNYSYTIRAAELVWHMRRQGTYRIIFPVAIDQKTVLVSSWLQG